MNEKFDCDSLLNCLEKVIDYRGKTPKKLGGEWTENGFRVISANNVKFEGLVKTDDIRYVDEKIYRKWMKDEVNKGDLILTSEAPAGQVMYWNSSEKIVLGQRLFCLRVKNKINSKYLKYYLQSKTGQREIFKNDSGSTVSGISAETFYNIILHYPIDTDIQKKIGNLLFGLDEKIDLNNRINAVLESMAKALYNYWFVQYDFPNEKGKPYKSSGGKMVWNKDLKRKMPDGWEVKKMKEVVDCIKDGVQPEEIDQKTVYIGLEHILRKSIVLSEWEFASKVDSTKCRFKEYDILFGKIRPYFHKVGICLMDGISSTDTIILRCKDHKNQGLILQTVFSDAFVKKASIGSTGTKMPRADWRIMKNYFLALPPEELRKRYQKIHTENLKRIKNAVLENRELSNLRDWLLPMLMNGQVKVG